MRVSYIRDSRLMSLWWKNFLIDKFIGAVNNVVQQHPPACSNAASSKKCTCDSIHDFMTWTFRVMSYLSNKTISRWFPRTEPGLVGGGELTLPIPFCKHWEVVFWYGLASTPGVHQTNFWGKAQHEWHHFPEQTELFPGVLALARVVTAAASSAATLRSQHAVGY